MLICKSGCKKQSFLTPFDAILLCSLHDNHGNREPCTLTKATSFYSFSKSSLGALRIR